jgi:hypothetical protein
MGETRHNAILNDSFPHHLACVPWKSSNMTALQFVQQNPTITTNSTEFQCLGLDDIQCKNLAYQLIDAFPFVGQSITVYTNRCHTSTAPIILNQVDRIKNYLKAFINLDRSPLERYFPQYDVAETQRTIMIVREIIDKRDDLLHIYMEYKQDVIERSKLSIFYQKTVSSKYTMQLMPLQRFPFLPHSVSPQMLIETAVYLER